MLRALGLPETTPVEWNNSPLPSGPRTTTFLQHLARAFEHSGGSGAISQRTDALRSFASRLGNGPLAAEAATRQMGELGSRPAGSLEDLVVAAARQEGLPPALLAALVQVESGFQPQAVSRVGAKGLTQLMDGTAKLLGVTDPFDPWQNLVGGARYLRHLLNRYSGNLPLALAAYNAGPGAVDAAGGNIPPYAETHAHVRRVLAHYSRFSSLFPPEGRGLGGVPQISLDRGGVAAEPAESHVLSGGTA